MVNTERPAGKALPKGVIIFSILIFLYALHGFPLPGFKSYYSKFYPSTEWLVFSRYILSFAVRVILIICAVGLFLRREIFRKITLFIGFFTIATVYWKHPVSVFKKVLIWKVAQGVLPISIMPRIDTLAWTSAVLCYIVDIAFFLCLIYYFTRPGIKRQFG